MSLTESERQVLIDWFRAHMDPQQSELMMKVLPPVAWTDLATKHDLAELEARMDLRFRTLAAELRAEMHSLVRQQTYAFFGGMTVLLSLFTAINQLLG